MRWGPTGKPCKSNQSPLHGDQLGENRGQMRTLWQEEPAGRGVRWPVLVEAMHNPLKRGKLDYRNWLKSVGRTCRSQEAEKCLPSGETGRRRIGSHADQGWGLKQKKAILQGCLGWGLMSSRCSKSRMQPAV